MLPLILVLWFSSANSYLSGNRPKDMIIENPDFVTEIT